MDLPPVGPDTPQAGDAHQYSTTMRTPLPGSISPGGGASDVGPGSPLIAPDSASAAASGCDATPHTRDGAGPRGGPGRAGRYVRAPPAGRDCYCVLCLSPVRGLWAGWTDPDQLTWPGFSERRTCSAPRVRWTSRPYISS